MTRNVFTIIAQDKESKARSGILHTKNGDVATPFFMPVATKTAVKHISTEDLEAMHAQAIISNSLVLSMRPGVSVIQKFGGIGKFMMYSGVVFTDSGGFQMYSPHLYLGSKENGVMFRNPYSGEKIFMTPEQDMDIQLALNSDVAMCLDSMPLISESKEAVAEAVRKTSLWAQQCRVHHDTRQTAIEPEQQQLLFGIIQGGIHTELREQSAKALAALDFPGYAIGGLALGEPKDVEYQMIEIAKSQISDRKPIYLMGAGNPIELLEAISRGVDMFDSRFPTQNARRGTLFSSQGYLRITNAPYKDDETPIDLECSCFVCKRYSKAYIRHLLVCEEGVGFQLTSFHNLFYLQELMRQTHAAIQNGTFRNLKEKIKKIYAKN